MYELDKTDFEKAKNSIEQFGDKKEFYKEAFRLMQESFTEEKKEKVNIILEKILVQFPSFCKRFESNKWVKAFDSKELQHNVKVFKNFEGMSDKEKEILQDNKVVLNSIINLEAGFDTFKVIKNNVLALAFQAYSELNFSENMEASIVIASMVGIEEELHKLENLVMLTKDFFIKENEETCWSYTSMSATIITKNFHELNCEFVHFMP